jgi:predicted enzyme related to lactoylglutathione lyase
MLTKCSASFDDESLTIERKTMTALVTHFEIFAEEPAKLADFYRELFGWKIEKAAGVDYFHIQTAPSEERAIRGGLTYRPISGPRSWVHYVWVESLDGAVERVQRLGGSVLRPKTAVPKTGWYAVVEDPERNIFAVFQPDPTAMPDPEPD